MQSIFLKWMIFEHWFNRRIGWFMTNIHKQSDLEKIIKDKEEKINKRKSSGLIT